MKGGRGGRGDGGLRGARQGDISFASQSPLLARPEVESLLQPHCLALNLSSCLQGPAIAACALTVRWELCLCAPCPSLPCTLTLPLPAPCHCSLCADSEMSVQNAVQFLDNLVKDIVTSNPQVRKGGGGGGGEGLMERWGLACGTVSGQPGEGHCDEQVGRLYCPFAKRRPSTSRRSYPSCAASYASSTRTNASSC